MPYQLYFSNNDMLIVDFNGTLPEAQKHYVGELMPVGYGVLKIVRVEPLPEKYTS